MRLAFGRAALVAGALALTAAAGWALLGPSTDPMTVAAQLEKNRKGLSLGGATYQYDDETLERHFDDFVRLGAGWVRVDVPWSQVESERGVRDWTQPARIVDAALRRGLAVVAVIAYAPEWARNPECVSEPMCEPADVAAFADYAEAVVRRFAPSGVLVYEVWNEPNSASFWKPRANPELYAQLLRQAYPRMKQADARISVLAGATAPVGAKGDPGCDGGEGLYRGDGSMNAVDFVEQVYGRARGFFDALSHHPYDNRGFGEHRCSAWHQMSGTNPSLRSLMIANGDGEKQLWATEYGDDAAFVGEEVKAARVREAFDRWLAQPWTAALMYYTYHDRACCEGYRLIGDDGSRRPAWYAYRDYTRE